MPIANAGFGGNECDLDFVLNAVPGLGTGTWSMTSGTGSAIFIPGPASPDATVIVNEEGEKEFTWTVTNGACVDAETIEALSPVYKILPADINKGTYRNISGNKATAWGCDLTYDYVKINAEYTT